MKFEVVKPLTLYGMLLLPFVLFAALDTYSLFGSEADKNLLGDALFAWLLMFGPWPLLIFPSWVGALASSAQGLSKQLPSTGKKVAICGVASLMVLYFVIRVIAMMSRPIGPDPL